MLPAPFFECPLEIHGAETHATRCPECRQECRERGYYHLHRQLNHSLFFHLRSISFALVESGKWNVERDMFCGRITP